MFHSFAWKQKFSYHFFDLTTEFISLLYSDEIWPPHVFYTMALKLIFFNSFSTFHHSIAKLIISITTKLWPKTVSKILVPWKIMEQFRRTFVFLSMNSRIWTEISSMKNHGKPISINEIYKFHDIFSMKLRFYRDGIRGNPPEVSTVL